MPIYLGPDPSPPEHILPIEDPTFQPVIDFPIEGPGVIPTPVNPGKLPPDLTPVTPNDPTIQERIEAMNNYDGSRKGTVAIPPSDSRFDENAHVKYYAKESQEPTLEDYLKKYANIITIAVGVLAIITFIRR